MTLYEGNIAKTYKIKSINLETEVKRRFEVLGMTVDSKISIINAKGKGAMIVRIRGTRFAIGKEFAQGIEVEVCADE